jgi:CBS domain containing-hemolysin-like protein
VIEGLLLTLALGLVAANAVFVAAEFSMVTVDRSAVERATEAGDPHAHGVLTALGSLSTQLSGAQFGITVTSLLVGFITQPSLAALLEGPVESIGAGGATPALALALALALATSFQMVFGELVPKNAAIARPYPVARAVTPAQRAFTAGARPLITFLNGNANGLLRAMGIEPQEELRSARSARELGSLVARSAAKGTLAAQTAGLMTRSIAFGERTAADVMTPRVRVRFVERDDPLHTVIEAVRETGHSRFPVTGPAGVDDLVGIVHIKHALAVPADARAGVRVGQVMSAPLVVPGSVELDPLLVLLRRHGLQMAVVVDEYGGTDGVVTLEDLVEELVGDIADEHDRPGAHARRRADGSWSLSGLLRPDEVTAITGVPLPEGDDFDTLAGLMLDRLEHVPAAGESHTEITATHLATLTVERMDGRRIDRVRLHARPLPTDDPEPADS